MPQDRLSKLVDRRQFLQASGAALLFNPVGRWSNVASAQEPKARPRIAVITTEYRGYSHADVIVTRLIQGYELSTSETYWPRTQIVSMFRDQVPAGDLSSGFAAQAGAKIVTSIRDALTLGTNQLAVDGVLIIGEHGNYPRNEKGQLTYPRRRFFEETVKTFQAVGATVPVFNDKGLSYSWDDAKWMYDQSRTMKFPLMAGSSLPTTWRRPDLEVPLGTKFEECLSIGYGDLDAYGFHALETLQCMAERRQGGETGIKSITCLEGDAVWEAAKAGRWSRDLLDAAVNCVESKPAGTPEQHCKNPQIALIEYADGLRASMIMLNGYTRAFGFAGRIQGQHEPVATHFWLQEPEFGHFSYLVHNVEAMYLTGKEPYPAERTLLTTGVLDAIFTSRFEQHRRVETPWLTEVKYQVGPESGRRAKFS